MEQKHHGGPAFPIPLAPGQAYQGHGPCDGMTLRDYFAAKAMQGFSANAKLTTAPVEKVAEWSYEQADAMLAARAK